jgi:hypothetical protein
MRALPSGRVSEIAALRKKWLRVSDLKWGPITCRTLQTRSVWKVTRVYSITVTIILRDSHTDNQPEAWCRDKGSEELKSSDSSVSTH